MSQLCFNLLRIICLERWHEWLSKYMLLNPSRWMAWCNWTCWSTIYIIQPSCFHEEKWIAEAQILLQHSFEVILLSMLCNIPGLKLIFFQTGFQQVIKLVDIFYSKALNCCFRDSLGWGFLRDSFGLRLRKPLIHFLPAVCFCPGWAIPFLIANW